MLGRTVVGFLNTYARARAGGSTHMDALETVLHSYKSLSIGKQADAWVSFIRPRPDSAPRDKQADFEMRIFCMLYAYNGPWDDATMSRIIDQISKATNNHPIKWD